MDAHRRNLLRAAGPDIDVKLLERCHPAELFRRSEVPGHRTNQAETTVHVDLPATEESVASATDSIETKISVRLDALHDEPDLIHVGANHETGAFWRPRFVAVTFP